MPNSRGDIKNERFSFHRREHAFSVHGSRVVSRQLVRPPNLGQAVLDRHNHDTSVSPPSPQEDQSYFPRTGFRKAQSIFQLQELGVEARSKQAANSIQKHPQSTARWLVKSLGPRRNLFPGTLYDMIHAFHCQK